MIVTCQPSRRTLRIQRPSPKITQIIFFRRIHTPASSAIEQQQQQQQQQQQRKKIHPTKTKKAWKKIMEKSVTLTGSDNEEERGD